MHDPMLTITDAQARALRRAVKREGDATAALDAVDAVRANPPWKRPHAGPTAREMAAKAGALRTPAQQEARRRNMAVARQLGNAARRKFKDAGPKPSARGWYVRTTEGANLGPFAYRSYAEKRAKTREGAEVVFVD